MADLDLFAGAGDGLRPEHFGLDVHGRAYVIASVFATAMGYASTQKATDLVDPDEKGYEDIKTWSTSGVEQVRRQVVFYEDGIWELIFRSTMPSAKSIKARVKAILRELRETGVVDTRKRPAELSRRELAVMVIAEADRADAAEAKVNAISGGVGHTPSDWREMFMLTPEREFFEHLYTRGYLIDQRGTRSKWVKGRKVYKSGTDHGKPRAPLGDVYFKLVPTGTYGDKDRMQTVVRPDKSEALRDRLVSEGLAAAPVDRKQIGEVS